MGRPEGPSLCAKQKNKKLEARRDPAHLIRSTKERVRFFFRPSPGAYVPTPHERATNETQAQRDINLRDRERARRLPADCLALPPNWAHRWCKTGGRPVVGCPFAQRACLTAIA